MKKRMNCMSKVGSMSLFFALVVFITTSAPLAHASTESGGSYYQGYSAPTCWLSTSPQYINAGQSATISWSSNNTTSGYINGVGTVYGSGQSFVYPSQTTQYAATFTGPGGSTNCYATVVVNGATIVNGTTVVSSITPYITLSQVPYTGLDLGPIGTAVYWIGLVLICAILAYLIAVKRVQNSSLTWLRVKLLGDPDIATHPAYVIVSEGTRDVSMTPTHNVSKPTQKSDFIDPFLLRQIFPVRG